jgi:hypothetical protein
MSSSDEGAARTVSTSGGVVSGRCSDGTPVLLYATPADGYRTVRTASVVRFVGRSREVTLTLSCSDDELHVRTHTDRIGTVPRSTPKPTPAPTSTSTVRSRKPQPTERPEPSDTPEPQETSEGLDDHSGSGDG